MVEDDELVRGITVRALRALGYRILLAEDGEDALKVVEQPQRHGSTWWSPTWPCRAWAGWSWPSV